MEEAKKWVSPITGRVFLFTEKCNRLPLKEVKGDSCRLGLRGVDITDVCPDVPCRDCVYFVHRLGITESDFLAFCKEHSNERKVKKYKLNYVEVDRFDEYILLDVPYYPLMCSGLIEVKGDALYLVSDTSGPLLFLDIALTFPWSSEARLYVPLKKYYQFAFDVYKYNNNIQQQDT